MTVSFVSDAPITDAAVTLKNASGAAVCKAKSFSVDASPWRRIALIAIPSTVKAGDYALETFALRGCEAIVSTVQVRVERRAFAQESITLDSANTAIKSDLGSERLAQIEALTKILSTFDSGAPRFSGPYKAPVASKRRTSPYGERRVYRYDTGKSETGIHFGIDYGIPAGTPVFASGDGIVVMAERRISTGWTVVIEHLPGVYSLYYHLDALTSSAGESVRTGTLIGRSGATGLATGPHLHFEWRVNGEAVSPDWFIENSLF